MNNQKISFWYHGTSLTGSHTKPPIMPHFSECPHLPFTYLFAAVFGFLLLGRTPFFSPIAMSVVCISVIIFVFPLFSQMSLIPREKSTKKERKKNSKENHAGVGRWYCCTSGGGGIIRFCIGCFDRSLKLWWLCPDPLGASRCDVRIRGGRGSWTSRRSNGGCVNFLV